MASQCRTCRSWTSGGGKHVQSLGIMGETTCKCKKVHTNTLFHNNREELRLTLKISQALIEILLLSGGTPFANFRHLAHAWGRDRGFHHVLINTVCERRGEIDRKRRSDARGFTIGAAKKTKLDSDDQPTVESVYMQAAGVLSGGIAVDDSDDEASSPRKRAAQV